MSAHAHDHDHSPVHSHGHDENPHAGQGAVLLDIGGDIGALVVTMPGSMVGEEIDIGPHHQPLDQPRQHVAVVARPVAVGRVPSLVYPELHHGGYDLMPKGTDDVRLTVEVRGGEVTSADWPA